jgi:hypothetical protein
MAIKSVQINSTMTDIFVSTGDKMVATIIFCNQALPNPQQDDSNVSFLDMHLVKNGEISSTVNRIVNTLMIPAGETVFFDTERIVLENGDKVTAISTSPAVITATISTVDI